MTTVYIPTSMRELTQGQARLNASGTTVADVFKTLEVAYPGLQTRLYDQQGQLNSYIAVFVNEQSIRELNNEQTPVTDRDEVHIIPAIAGG
jgi:adenylyltransferase/sulfurtransferase